MIEIQGRKFVLDGQTDGMAMWVGMVGEKCVLEAVLKKDDGSDFTPEEVSVKLWKGDTGRLLWEGSPFFIGNGKWKVERDIDEIGTVVVRWNTVLGDVGTEMYVGVDSKVQYMMQLLRNQLDKSLKNRDRSWGYTDADLFLYLVLGLGYFNSITPPTQLYLGAVSDFMINMIVDLAVLYGLQAQSIYAIDTDVVYNDQGVSLTIDHFSKLSSVFDKVVSRIERLVRAYKLSMMRGAKLVMAYNPERARGWLFTQMLTPGFPYFAVYGITADFMFRG